MKPGWEVLGEGDLERIDREAVGLLGRTGLDVHSGQLRDLLRQRGARVEGERVRFPAELVRWAVDAAPATVRCRARDGRELPFEPGASYFSSYSDALFVTDFGATAQRPSTCQDVVDFTALVDALPFIDKVANACSARRQARARATAPHAGGRAEQYAEDEQLRAAEPGRGRDGVRDGDDRQRRPRHLRIPLPLFRGLHHEPPAARSRQQRYPDVPGPQAGPLHHRAVSRCAAAPPPCR